ncbi:MAG: ribokinase [Cryobacterium sp.]|nr:ribokinase [Cryobacterium sp.]
MSNAPRVVVVGSTMMDLVAYAPVLPAAGQTLRGTEFRMGFGGKGANQAVMAGTLGADVILVNRVGEDFFGEITRKHLIAQGITARLGEPIHSVSTGVAPIWVEPSGSNRIIIVPGANEAVTPAAVRSELADIEYADCVVCQLEVPQDAVAEAFRFGRRWGAINILNPAPAAPIQDDVLALADWLVPNESEFEMLFGAPPGDAEILRADTDFRGRLLVTLGESGSAFSVDESVRHVPALPVQTVDTTGAGDAFVGGFAYAIATGIDVEQAIKIATACGSLSTQRAGTQTSFPTADEVWSVVG